MLKEEGRRKKEEGRRKKEVERRKKGCQQLRMSSPSGAVAISIKFLQKPRQYL